MKQTAVHVYIYIYIYTFMCTAVIVHITRQQNRFMILTVFVRYETKLMYKTYKTDLGQEFASKEIVLGTHSMGNMQQFLDTCTIYVYHMYISTYIYLNHYIKNILIYIQYTYILCTSYFCLRNPMKLPSFCQDVTKFLQMTIPTIY